VSLTGTTRRLTDAERAREPRSLALVAWFDGWSRGGNPRARPELSPRRLTTAEAAAWRDGHREGAAERRCHTVHGFLPHTDTCGGPS